MLAVVTLVVTRSSEQMMTEMVYDHVTTRVTTLIRKATILRYRKQIEQILYYDYYSRMTCF